MLDLPFTLRQLLVLNVALALYGETEGLNERGYETDGDSDRDRDVWVLDIVGHELQHEVLQVAVTEAVRDMNGGSCLFEDEPPLRRADAQSIATRAPTHWQAHITGSHCTS